MTEKKEKKSKADYEVGKNKPPKHTRFKPGVSGNPSGRPKGRKNKPKELLKIVIDIVGKELLEEYLMNVNGKKVTISLIQGLIKQLNSQAVNGNLKALHMATQLTLQVAKLQSAFMEKEGIDRQVKLDQAIQYKRSWTDYIKDRRKRGLPVELPIPHPDHIHIDSETGEVSVECHTLELVNVRIDLIGEITRLEAMSLAMGLGSSMLWTEFQIRQFVCEHIQEDLDLSLPTVSSKLSGLAAALKVFKTMMAREHSTCDHEGCRYRNAVAMDMIEDYARYHLLRSQVPISDPLWREHGPQLVDQHLDYWFYYGPEPDVDAFKVVGASIPDKRSERPGVRHERRGEEVSFRRTFRDHLMRKTPNWSQRFDPERLEPRNIVSDYLVFRSYEAHVSQDKLETFFASIEVPEYLDNHIPPSFGALTQGWWYRTDMRR